MDGYGGMESEIIEIDEANMEDIRKQLFYYAMASDWEEVVRICRQYPGAHNVIIPASGETVLYMAVSERKPRIVDQLLQQIVTADALKIGNDAGDSPLHLAASIGHVGICESIAQMDDKLVGLRNGKGETPLFLAAHHGKRDAFLFLHRLSESSGQNYGYCRRDDGATILHSAIAGEHIDLAILIVHLYNELAEWVDQEGTAPLQLLAGKPSAFRSGTPFLWIERIIYDWMLVEEVKIDELLQESTVRCDQRKESLHYPDNYRTCINFSNTFKIAGTTTFGPASQNENAKILKDVSIGSRFRRAHRQKFPPNYDICFDFIKFANALLLIFLGLGFGKIKKIKDKKEKHSRSVQLMNKLLESASMHDYYNDGEDPRQPSLHKDGEIPIPSDQSFSFPGTSFARDYEFKVKERRKTERAILIAAANGVTEMVEGILEEFPVAIHDRNWEKKNAVLIAVENRQPGVYLLLVNRKFLRDSAFLAVDDEGNSALHLAAKLRHLRPWHIPGSAFQMQWEIKWYKFVKCSMPQRFFIQYNHDRLTPREIFLEEHSNMLKEGAEWLNSTCTSCSFVAALIAGVSFATSGSVPGSFNDANGRPNFASQSAFHVFAVSSLLALCSSMASLIMFLAIPTSRHEVGNYDQELPRKLLLGLSAMFISIAAMLVSFCAGHFYILGNELQYGGIPLYAAACLPISFFAVAEFPLYVDLIWATLTKVPRPRHKVVF